MANSNQSNQLPKCDRLWQYILIMNKDIKSSLDALDQIGWYHQTKEDLAQMTDLAKYTEDVAKTLRAKVEKLSGWENNG